MRECMKKPLFSIIYNLSPRQIDPISKWLGRFGNGVKPVGLTTAIHDEDITIM